MAPRLWRIKQKELFIYPSIFDVISLVLFLWFYSSKPSSKFFDTSKMAYLTDMNIMETPLQNPPHNFVFLLMVFFDYLTELQLWGRVR